MHNTEKKLTRKHMLQSAGGTMTLQVAQHRQTEAHLCIDCKGVCIWVSLSAAVLALEG